MYYILISTAHRFAFVKMFNQYSNTISQNNKVSYIYLFSLGSLFQCNWKKNNNPSNQSSGDNSNVILSEWLIIFNTILLFLLFSIDLNFDLLGIYGLNKAGVENVTFLVWLKNFVCAVNLKLSTYKPSKVSYNARWTMVQGWGKGMLFA